MSIRERLGRLAVSGLETVFGVKFVHGNPPSLTAYADAWLRGAGGSGGGVNLDRPYTQHAVVNQSVSVVAADFASVEWAAYPAKGSARAKATPLDDHEVLAWFERPTADMTRRDLMEASMIYYLLDGDLLWNFPDVVINPRGMIPEARLEGGDLELIPASGFDWNIVPGQRSQLIRAGTRQAIDPRTATLFRAFNPYGPRGAGKITPIFHDLRADLGAARWNEWQLADRNGMPTIVLKPPAAGASGTVDQREAVRSKWESTFPNSRRGVGVTPPGWDLAELGANRKDMEWSTMRSSVRETGLGIIGLVPFLAGVLDKANYANAREQKFVYWRGTQSRLLSAFQDKINNDLLPKLGVTDVKLYPRWEMVRAAADDVEQKSTTALKWFGMGISKKVINESLEMGWDPDDIEDYEVGYLPASYVPASMAGEMFVPPSEDDGVNNEKPNDPPRKACVVSRRTVETADQREARRAANWRLHVIRLSVYEAPVASIVRAWVNGLETQVLSRVRGLAGLRIVEQGRRLRSVGAASAETAVDARDVDSLMFDARAAAKSLVDRVTPRIRAALVGGGTDVITDAGLKVTFNPNDFRLAAKLVEGQLRVRGVSSTVWDHLHDALTDGINLGESASELADRVIDVMGAAKSRATTIARTEVGIAYSSGRFIGMKQASISRHEWLSAKDDLVRADHQPGTGDDGVSVDVGTPFPHSGLLYPLDPAGPPEQVINCRCTTLPVVTED